MIGLSANGRAVAWTETTVRSGARAHAVIGVDVRTSAPIFVYELTGEDPYEGIVEFDPCGLQVVVRRRGRVYVVGEEEECLTVLGASSIESHAFSPDGTVLAAGDVEGTSREPSTYSGGRNASRLRVMA